jgi:hypothetical protein
MVMPFGTKPTGISPDQGPAQVDFDSLWNVALKPLIEKLGYTPFRADSDTSALIINEMIERLAFADLVVADVSIPNANVYYEIGVRHAARSTGCVLLSATWAEPVFDIAQIRRLTYSLTAEVTGPSEAQIIQKQLITGIEKMASEKSPVEHIVPGIATLDTPESQVFKQLAEQKLRQFQEDLEHVGNIKAKIDQVHDMPSKNVVEKRKAALEVRNLVESEPTVLNSLRIEVMRLLRDCAGWEDMLEYIDTRIPETLRQSNAIAEQRLLALSNTSSQEEAVAHLKLLIKKVGPSSERYGLLGGRYKRLARDAADQGNEQEAHRFLNKAIESYELGMQQDLNDYYPTGNLPVLLRQRNRPGDIERAKFAAALTVAACQRQIQLGIADEWVPPTLLAHAFATENVSTAAVWADTVNDENHSKWKLDSTINDIRVAISLVTDSDTKNQLTSIADRLLQFI